MASSVAVRLLLPFIPSPLIFSQQYSTLVQAVVPGNTFSPPYTNNYLLFLGLLIWLTNFPAQKLSASISLPYNQGTRFPFLFSQSELTHSTRALGLSPQIARTSFSSLPLLPPRVLHSPSALSFELCDLDQAHIPYPDGYFDFVHARSMHIGVSK